MHEKKVSGLIKRSNIDKSPIIESLRAGFILVVAWLATVIPAQTTSSTLQWVSVPSSFQVGVRATFTWKGALTSPFTVSLISSCADTSCANLIENLETNYQGETTSWTPNSTLDLTSYYYIALYQGQNQIQTDNFKVEAAGAASQSTASHGEATSESISLFTPTTTISNPAALTGLVTDSSSTTSTQNSSSVTQTSSSTVHSTTSSTSSQSTATPTPTAQPSQGLSASAKVGVGVGVGIGGAAVLAAAVLFLLRRRYLGIGHGGISEKGHEPGIAVGMDNEPGVAVD